MGESDAETLHYLVETYRQVAGLPEQAGRELERDRGHAWRDGAVDTAAVGAVRDAIVQRGRREHRRP
jgi:hypothetical protein